MATMTFRRFEEIIAWQAARHIVREIYDLSEEGSFRRDFALKDQVRRAAISTMANIAEGFSRRSELEFAQFLFVAKASAAELQSHMYIMLDRGYVTQQRFDSLYGQTEHYAKQVSNLITHLRRSNRPLSGKTQGDSTRPNKTQ